MTEQVIDIRDRIEKMRDQITVPGAKVAKNEKQQVLSTSKSLEEKGLVTKKDPIANMNKTNNDKKLGPTDGSTNFVEKKDSLKGNEFYSKTNVVEKPSEKFSEESNNKYNQDFKTYSDYQNDRVTDEKKQSVNLEEKQPFPQFSLNVSNPISWKLMLLIMLMQLLTNMMLVVVLYLK